MLLEPGNIALLIFHGHTTMKQLRLSVCTESVFDELAPLFGAVTNSH